jgi:hypothetical protein
MGVVANVITVQESSRVTVINLDRCLHSAIKL